jgi:hypothetical protein
MVAAKEEAADTERIAVKRSSLRRGRFTGGDFGLSLGKDK